MSSKHHERPEVRPAGENTESPSPATEPSAQAVAQASAAASAGPEAASGAVPAPDAKDAELAALRERVAALEARESALSEELSSVKDQYLRKLADYENFRKRMFREREESLKFANTGILTDLIAILDDFDRAVGSAEHARDYVILHDGVVLIRRQMAQMLANKYGLTTFASAGQVFDPNIHEAIASEMAEVEEPMVSQEFLPGYKLHERVIRSAKVKVQMPAPGSAGKSPADPAEAGQAGSAALDGGDGSGKKAD